METPTICVVQDRYTSSKFQASNRKFKNKSSNSEIPMHAKNCNVPCQQWSHHDDIWFRCWWPLFYQGWPQEGGPPYHPTINKTCGCGQWRYKYWDICYQNTFQHFSDQAAEADTFDDLPSSLLSVGKTADDGKMSILTKKGVTVHKEEDVLITCKGAPILIVKRDERRRYRIPLVQ